MHSRSRSRTCAISIRAPSAMSLNGFGCSTEKGKGCSTTDAHAVSTIESTDASNAAHKCTDLLTYCINRKHPTSVSGVTKQRRRSRKFWTNGIDMMDKIEKTHARRQKFAAHRYMHLKLTQCFCTTRLAVDDPDNSPARARVTSAVSNKAAQFESRALRASIPYGQKLHAAYAQVELQYAYAEERVRLSNAASRPAFSALG